MIKYKLSDCYEKFINYQAAKGNSKATISYYNYCLSPFVLYYGDNYTVNEFNEDNLMLYALDLKQRILSSQSIRSYSKGVKVFLSWLFEKGYTKTNLSLVYMLPKADKLIIDVLSDDEILKLFNSFNKKTFHGLRNYCICALMFDSGLRKSEIIKLRLSDIHFNEFYIIVNGKGNKQRIVPLSSSIKYLLCDYCSLYSKNYVFVNETGNRITVSAIDRLFKTLKKKLLIPRLHAHLLRHSMATRYIINGGNLSDLKDILGHADIQTTEIYLHMAYNYIRSFSDYSPLNQLLE